jgi:hypothetical protein
MTSASCSFLPRGIPHTFLVTRGPVRGLQITAPSGFEDFIAEAGRPAQQPGLPQPAEPGIPRLVAAAQRYGSQILGPPPAPPSRWTRRRSRSGASNAANRGTEFYRRGAGRANA